MFNHQPSGAAEVLPPNWIFPTPVPGIASPMTDVTLPVGDVGICRGNVTAPPGTGTVHVPTTTQLIDGWVALVEEVTLPVNEKVPASGRVLFVV
jgi:hypothetical protein